MGRLVPAVTRAFDILELFLDRDTALTAPDIVRALGLPRTTVHELVATLVARGYLVADRSGGYRLGVRLYQLGSRYAEQLDLAAEGQQVARSVAEKCQETVHIAILEDTDVIYIAKVDSTQAVRLVSAAGRRLPAHCTAVGKMLLASLPEHELRSRIPDRTLLPAMTANTITDTETLHTVLADTRTRGTAVEESESNADASCVAAPVRDRTGQVVAALSISVPGIRWNTGRRAELEELAVAGAAELSTRLGYRTARP
jgi:IclR family KDG regulon transcriptional repressor